MYRPKGGKASPHWPWTQIGGLGKPDDGTVDGCAVVYSPRSTLYMAATIIPCDIQYATGVVCFVNQRPMTQNNHPTMPPPQPSPPPSPPSLPPTFVNALVQSEQSIFRTLTAAVCKLQSGASLRTTCDVFISGMFPPQNIATTPESPLCGDLYWRSHDLNEPSDKVQNFARTAAGGAYCWPSCETFKRHPDAVVARSGCLTFLRNACPLVASVEAQNACATHLRPPPSPPPSQSPPPPFMDTLEHVGFRTLGEGRCPIIYPSPPPPYRSNAKVEAVASNSGPRIQPSDQVVGAISADRVLMENVQSLWEVEFPKESATAIVNYCSQRCAKLFSNGPATCVGFSALTNRIKLRDACNSLPPVSYIDMHLACIVRLDRWLDRERSYRTESKWSRATSAYRLDRLAYNPIHYARLSTVNSLVLLQHLTIRRCTHGIDCTAWHATSTRWQKHGTTAAVAAAA